MVRYLRLVVLVFLGVVALGGCAPDNAVVVTIRTQAFNGWAEEQPPPGEPIVATLRPGESVSAPHLSDDVVFTVRSIDNSTVELSSSHRLVNRSTGSNDQFTDRHRLRIGEELELNTGSEDYEVTYWITVQPSQ